MPSFAPSRRWGIVLVVFVVVLYCMAGIPRPHQLQQSPVEKSHAEFTSDLVPFWAAFSRILVNAVPRCSPPKRWGDPAPLLKFEDKDEHLERLDLLDMPDEDIEQMKQAHTWIVGEIPKLPRVPFKKGTRGIVTTAGGPYMPIMVVSLIELRRTGSTLPVEIFMRDADEYEKAICDEKLPELNAKCIVLADTVNKVPIRMKIEHYQLKIFAILFSSFEEILFLDADSMPFRKPDHLFDVEPYSSTHMVVWPDFWVSTASPIFYEVASVPVPPLYETCTAESGQMVISKATHASVLCLAAYYNFYGPNYYYPLITQGGPGEGDKDTFVAAAQAFNQSFYMVREPVQAPGHFDKDGGFTGVAMIQADPGDDYGRHVLGNATLTKARSLFAHLNLSKMNAGGGYWDLYDENGKRRRLMGVNHEEQIQKYGRDMELECFETMNATCTWPFRAWEGKEGICEKVLKDYTDLLAE
ncbi:MAG: hypothetical protein M1836_000286 [Candelina mexicana]|nr:MAG: hypothetical protein M1836_000286 [Candelina mexicana]